MAERPLFEMLVEKLFGRRKSMLVPVDQARLEDLGTEGENFSFLPVFLRQGDRRLINNLEMRVDDVFNRGELIKLTFTEKKTQLNGSCSIAIDDIRNERSVIQIGRLGRIVYRGLDEDGRAIFAMAMAPDVDVHSKNRPERKHKPLLTKATS